MGNYVRIGRLLDVTGEAFWGIVDDYGGTVDPLIGRFEEWAPGVAKGIRPGDLARDERRGLADLRLIAPTDAGSRIFGVGMNYPRHLDRSGAELPPGALPGFVKLRETLVGPGAPIRHPSTDQLDAEVEVVAVLAAMLPPTGDATSALLGYTLGNDVSVRDAPGGTMDLYTMKAQDSTSPVGPWIVTLDELGGPGQPCIDFELKVNGAVRQRDNTQNMLSSVDRILRSLDSRTKLRPGDLVFTGASGGTGQEDGSFLRPGDRIVLASRVIGVMRNRVGAREDIADVGD